MDVTETLLTKDLRGKAQEFLNLIERAESTLGRAEQIGWWIIKECRGSDKEEDNETELLGWSMQSIANEIRHFITNTAGTAEDWDRIEKTAN